MAFASAAQQAIPPDPRWRVSQSLFTSYEELLFTRVVALAEKAGKHFAMLVVPSSNFVEAAAGTAAQLDSAKIIAGRSSVMTPGGQLELLSHRHSFSPANMKLRYPQSWRKRGGRSPCFYYFAQRFYLLLDYFFQLHFLEPAVRISSYNQ